MTAPALLLEDFDLMEAPRPARGPAPAPPPPDDAALRAAEEQVRLAAYEDGYRSGWDDATAAATETRTLIETDVAQNLRDLGFTFLEAREQMLAAVARHLTDLFETFFPASLARATAEAAEDAIRREAERATAASVEIRACPDDADLIAELLPDDLPVRPVVRPEPSLARGQAHVRIDAVETRIDLAAALAALCASGRALGDEIERTAARA